MMLPHFPGRYDGSAEALSFAVRMGSYASLLLVPAGIGMLILPGRRRLWSTIVAAALAVTALAITTSFIVGNQAALGVVSGIGWVILLRQAIRRWHQGGFSGSSRQGWYYLVIPPIALLVFQVLVLPRAASWSRDRAIQNCAPLIEAIERYRERHKEYPPSLHSLNSDFPTGVAGIERFHFEPAGQAYQIYFVRQHVEPDAKEVILFNPRDEHRFPSHDLDILEFDGAQLAARRGDWRRLQLDQPHWISVLFD